MASPTTQPRTFNPSFPSRLPPPRCLTPVPCPCSEPEVQIILGLARQFQPHVWLNVHSGMQALFTPYDHKPYVPEGPGNAASLRILELINQDSCKQQCAVGSGGKSVG